MTTAWPSAAAHVEVPGRMQVVAERPLTLYDGAHNPSGIAALAAALPDVLGDRPPVVVVSVLDDKDAAAMLRALLPLAAGAVFTARPTRARSRRPRSPRSPASSAAAPLEIEPDPRRAVQRAQELAGAGARSWRRARSTSWPTSCTPAPAARAGTGVRGGGAGRP